MRKIKLYINYMHIYVYIHLFTKGYDMDMNMSIYGMSYKYMCDVSSYASYIINIMFTCAIIIYYITRYAVNNMNRIEIFCVLLCSNLYNIYLILCD